MQYREFGKTGIMVSAIGMGTTRFPYDDVHTQKGIERCSSIVEKAAKRGVNFFDSATTYAGGKCEEILRIALQQIKCKVHICSKSSCYQERTRDDVLRHIEESLKNIGIDCFSFYYMWNVKSFSQYQTIMARGGPYEGALEAKRQGLTKHICFSSHAPANEAIKIIEDGAFEGITVSYSLLNFRENEAVLVAAQQKGMGISVMNPLGGGIIPQNTELFNSCLLSEDKNVVDAALKFVYSHKAVSTVMCGVSCEKDLIEDVAALDVPDTIPFRYKYVSKNIKPFSAFCTGCGYCEAGCPARIPISKLMMAYNQTKFCAKSSFFNRNSSDIIKKINVFKELDGVVSFHDALNPCLHCGQCERICTQRLPVIHRLKKIYDWVDECCVSDTGRKNRLKDILHANYRRVGFYTAGFYTSFIMNLYQKFLGDFPFEVYVFDSAPSRWGKLFLERFVIESPDKIPAMNLDVLLISNYIHENEIYRDLTEHFPKENIKRLHKEEEIPWTF